MIPLTLAEQGLDFVILKIRGNNEAKQFLESLGFVEGSKVAVISKAGGNVIVRIKDSRVAIGQEMASKIMV